MFHTVDKRNVFRSFSLLLFETYRKKMKLTAKLVLSFSSMLVKSSSNLVLLKKYITFIMVNGKKMMKPIKNTKSPETVAKFFFFCVYGTQLKYLVYKEGHASSNTFENDVWKSYIWISKKKCPKTPRHNSLTSSQDFSRYISLFLEPIWKKKRILYQKKSLNYILDFF